MTARVAPNDAMRLVLSRLRGYGRDTSQVGNGPQWITGCPTEGHIRGTVRWDQLTNDSVRVHACGDGCTADQVLAGLSIDDNRIRPYSPNGDQFTGPARPGRQGPPGDGLAIFEKLKHALEDGGFAWHRAATGRYQCPACGAPGDGHGLRVNYDPSRPRRILLLCDANRCPVDEILEPLGMTVAELCADDDTDDLRPNAVADELAGNPMLDKEVEDQWRRRRAREIVDELEQQRNPRPAPDAAMLGEILARESTLRWRAEDLLSAGGRMLLSAQRKTGKTTATGNLARSLLTGEPFLGKFEISKLTGRIVALNYEVTAELYAAWMDAIGVPRDRLYVVNLRGRRNLLADDAGRAVLVDMIRAQDGEVLVIDPFGRAFTGRNQNDAAEVTPWLVRLEDLAEQAGIAELVLTAHAGWEGERTRGSSALEDWPDVIVTMTRDPDTDIRFMKAEGRDVDVPEDQLSYDSATRRLTLTGAGNRRELRSARYAEILAEAVRDIATARPGINTGELEGALRAAGHHLQRGVAGAAANLAVERGWIRREAGPRNSKLHYPPDIGQESFSVPQ
jgi:hypothetical protein